MPWIQRATMVQQTRRCGHEVVGVIWNEQSDYGIEQSVCGMNRTSVSGRLDSRTARLFDPVHGAIGGLEEL